MTRTLLAAAIAITAAVALPSLAHGSTIYQDGRTPHKLLLQDVDGEANLISVEGTQSVVFTDLNAPIEVAGVPTCMPLDERTVSCSAVRRIELDLGGAGDYARINTPHPVSIEGGNGPDRYNAMTDSGASRVDFHGGIGRDSVNYGYATAGVVVSVDTKFGDGRPGDYDRIDDTVETVIGSQYDDVITGSRYTEQLYGLGGDDRITGGSGPELLAGGEGNDRIDARDGAADTIDCGGWLRDWAAVDANAEASIKGCAEIVS
jgi:hypothetical protein